MYPVIGICPICGENLVVSRLYCRACDSTIDGHFTLGRFYHLTPEQLSFLETFIRCEGKLTRLQEELGMSYPTARARLTEAIQALGYQVEELEASISAEDRRKVLEQLAEGDISAEEAVALLQGE